MQRKCCWLRAMVLCVSGASASAQDIFLDQRSYIEAFEAPRLFYTLRNYMREPGMLLELSRPAFSMEVIGGQEACGLSEAEELRQWLFTQTVAVSDRVEGSAITMLYVGMTDGRFIGYYHDNGTSPSRYTFRAAGTSAASDPELEFGQYASADVVPDALAGLFPTCDTLATSDGSSVCPVGCSQEDAGCHGSASTAFTLKTVCPSGSSIEDCTPTQSNGMAGCCDKNIRVHLSTSVETRGQPQELTKWTTYDHRQRAWYIEETARSEETGGWSSVYVFSSSGQLGITRTAKLQRSDGVSVRNYGVLGIDFELVGLSQIIADSVAGMGSWAYVVETGGANAGLLVGTTFRASLRDEISGDRCFAHGICGNDRTIQSESIAATATKLAETSWQATAPGQVLTNTIPGDLRDPDFKCCRKSDGVKYEATASVFATGGLEWLVVVGRDITCQPHEIFVFGKCQDCPGGQVPLDDRTCVICAEAFPGTISDEGIDGGTGTQCVCPTGTYAVRDGNVDKCQPCSMLPSKVVGVREEIADPIAWEGEAVCPGGVSWHTRICPLHKLWVEIEERQSDASGETTEVTLFTCPACVSGPCVNSSYLDTQSSSLQTTIGGVGLQPNAVCREHHTGFLCADCESNYKTVEGECVPCESTDWTWVVTEGFSAIMIGLFLLSKTWHSVCKPTDADNVFQLMDTAKDGFLSGNEIRTLLVRMGNPVAASSNFENVLADMKAKDIWNSQKCGSMRVHLPRWCGGISPPDKGWVLRDSVSRHEFHDWCAANQNRATVGMYVFAVQTFALVTAKTSDFSILELFNMDVSNAIKSCRMPNCGLLCGIAGMGVVPVLAGCSMYLGIWYMSTRVGTDELSQTVAEADSLKSTGDYDGAEIALKRVTSKRGSTARIDSAYKPRRGLPMRWHHLQRGVMQLYLFTFAPVTRRCAELLICREVTHRGVTEVLLVSDLSVTCWSGPHFVAAIISVAILSVYAIVLPSYLLMRTRKYLLTRDHEKPVEQRDLREPSCCDPRTFLSAQRLDRDVDPAILSRMKATPTLNPKCWDELIKATRPERYYWFIFMLLLKMLVNLIFLLGQAVEYNWGMWLQICLVLSALLSHYVRPYELTSDNRQEQMSFLGLSLVLTVTNSGVRYAGAWKWYHISVVAFVILVSTASMVWIQWRAAQKKSARKTRVKRAQKDLKEFTRHAFSVAVPTFLLLRDEDRVNIRRAIQVETFEQGDTIYCEGDDANAFYVVKEGLVTISSSQEGRSERIISSGDPFGAGALESAPRKRVATAIATTQDVLCLRLTRSDWLHTWHAMTDEIAESVFEKLDLEGTGSIERHELEIVLTERWTKDSAADEALLQLVHDVVSSLLVLFDDAGDGRISLAEFKRNLRSVPADDYAATDAGQLSSDAPPLAQACPFQYFHIDPRTEKREPYSSAENEAIFAAHSQDRGSVRLAHPYEVRFGCQAVSKKMQKPSYTGMCQVNLENHNTRIVERANTLDSSNDEATVRLSPSQHSEYVYFHIDPTTNRRCAFTTEDNSKIQAAETEGRAAVKISDVVNPHSGKTMRFEVRFGSNARSKKMPRTAFTGLCQVNLDNENTRIVVREVRKLSEPHLGTSLPDAEMGSRAVHTDSARHGSSVKTTKTRPDAP